jgi:hypothetical protein
MSIWITAIVMTYGITLRHFPRFFLHPISSTTKDYDKVSTFLGM